MSVDLQKVLASKDALRRRLAALPVAQKLRMLDAMRTRALALRHAAARAEAPPRARPDPPC